MVPSTVIDKVYETDHWGFLKNFNTWDKEFAEVTARKLGITDELTLEHWEVINYIRNTFQSTGYCPTVFETAQKTQMHRRVLKKLFPHGYLRGACLLAGITYREGFVQHRHLANLETDIHLGVMDKEYQVNLRGFLMDPTQWDKSWAIYKAYEMKIPDGLTARHWEIIYFLRNTFENTGKVPSVHETCDEVGIELDEFQKLFPDGYHRGAVKVAGLKTR